MEHTCPLVGSISPTSMLINVLFPAPLGPNKPRISPEKRTAQTSPTGSAKCFISINKTAQQQAAQLQPFFTQRETCLVATFFIFLPSRNSFLSSNSLCRLLTRIAGIWQGRGEVAAAALGGLQMWDFGGIKALPPHSWGCSGSP